MATKKLDTSTDLLRQLLQAVEGRHLQVHTTVGRHLLREISDHVSEVLGEEKPGAVDKTREMIRASAPRALEAMARRMPADPTDPEIYAGAETIDEPDENTDEVPAILSMIDTIDADTIEEEESAGTDPMHKKYVLGSK